MRIAQRISTSQVIPLLIGTLLFISALSAQRLALRSYQTGDGLAHNNVKNIFQDAKGYLWIATWEGLSRFDGYSFTNYGTADGLGHSFINDVTADNQGRIWVATNGGGVAMLIEQPPENSSSQRKKFVTFNIAEGGENNPANLVNRIMFDTENRLWCATDDGLYRAANLDVADHQFKQMAPGIQPTETNGALRDSRGRLWFSTSLALLTGSVFQITDGKAKEYKVLEAESADPPVEVHTLIEDSGGRILAAGSRSIFEFVEPAGPNETGTWHKTPIVLPPSQISAFASAPDGGLWIGGGGLLRLMDSGQTFYTTANGLSVNAVTTLFTDREGNLWIGTNGGGLNKLSGDRIVSYTVGQGLTRPNIGRIIEDHDGRIYAQMACTIVEITEKAGIVPFLESADRPDEGCTAQLLLQDVQRNWWFSGERGLEFFSSDADLNRRRGKLVTDENGLPIKSTSIYEDSERNIWLTQNYPGGNLFKIERGIAPRAQLVARDLPVEYIIRDKTSRTVWLGNRAKLWRLRNGQIKEIEKIEGLPILQPRCLFQDSKGRVWIGTRFHGAVMAEEPEADEPRFSRLTSADGLSSDTIWQIAEDDAERMYFGTGRGIDQLDTTTGKIHHFTTDEGAISADATHLLKDRRGWIWAAGPRGITRIDPTDSRRVPDAPPIYISQVRIAGEDLPLPETGAVQLPAIELSASQNHIAIKFVGLSFLGENALRYEYKLDGVDEDWVAAGDLREVNYGNLGAGNYRFSVRAVNSEKIASEQPATFGFTISPPFYLRWWFMATASILVVALVYAFYRNRLQRLLAIERTRTRIATDLHDDIGSELSKISLLSDIVRMKVSDNPDERDRMLGTIAEISRSSVDAMRDIVWAINPKRDSVLEMSRRMRTHAEEVFVDKGVNVKFDAPADGNDLKLSMDVRRELFLIFKEAVNNAARHSACTLLDIDFHVSDREVFLKVADNGQGFDPSAPSPGNGLLNMQNRAETIGGRFEIDVKGGTTVKVRIPG